MMHEKKHLDLLQQSIDFFFKDISLLIEACTHSSSLKKKLESDLIMSAWNF